MFTYGANPFPSFSHEPLPLAPTHLFLKIRKNISLQLRPNPIQHIIQHKDIFVPTIKVQEEMANKRNNFHVAVQIFTRPISSAWLLATYKLLPRPICWQAAKRSFTIFILYLTSYICSRRCPGFLLFAKASVLPDSGNAAPYPIHTQE